MIMKPKTVDFFALENLLALKRADCFDENKVVTV